MNELPPEIIDVILDYACDGPSFLVTMSHICRHWYRSIEFSSLWSDRRCCDACKFYSFLTYDNDDINNRHGTCHMLWHVYADRKSPLCGSPSRPDNNGYAFKS